MPLTAFAGAKGWLGDLTGQSGGMEAQAAAMRGFGWVLRSLTQNHAAIVQEIANGLEV